MSVTKLLVGISVGALAAASASAQQTNTSNYQQSGTGNQATVDNTIEGNTGNVSTINQTGTLNSATVFQRNAFNESVIRQIGTSNRATQQQVGVSNTADARSSGNFNGVAVTQIGNSNASTLIQDGSNNRSTVRQGYEVNASVPDGELRATNFNTVDVEQRGGGLHSLVSQRAASASARAANENRAQVVQSSAGASESIQQNSTLTQESRGDFARVVQEIGSARAANASTLLQRDATGLAGTGLSLNSATVSQSGVGLDSQVTQDGRRNAAGVRMRGGGDTSAQAQRSTVVQTGSDLRANINFDRLRGSASVGNTGVVTQSGAFNEVDAYQLGTGETNTISQADGVNTQAYADGARPRASAFVSQNGIGSASSITQTGDNLADVTQAFGTGSAISISQVDAGDVGTTRSRNSALASQYGNGNTATVLQNAIGASAVVWQQLNTSNNALEIAQGIGATGRASTTSVAGFGAGPTGAGAQDLGANVTQGGSFNDASLLQDGTNLRATVVQTGAGAAGARTLGFISQTGSGNSASLRQNGGVGPSAGGDPASGVAGDEFFFGGGARSAEGRILQTSSGNSATIVQSGRGQLARIEQSGPNNLASILQDTGATNATAVIRQSGTGNSFYVVQNQPGQYISVTQAGNGNVATNIVQRGATGGSAGFTPPSP